MRRLLIAFILFSLFLSGCNSPISKSIDPTLERKLTAFDSWKIPGTFVPKRIHVVGLGDSLTQGIGDELKVDGYFGRLTTVMEDWKGVKDIQADNLAKKGRRSDELITQLESPTIQSFIRNADVILFTIGGNDIMKIVKRDLFNLKQDVFYDELKNYEQRLGEIFGIIRGLNADAIIIAGGLYNPLSILTNEAQEFEDIIKDWNNAIEVQTVLDNKACFIPVEDLFDSNNNMVYHTDFFHPNAKGYEQMTNRFIEGIDKCGLFELSDGKLDM